MLSAVGDRAVLLHDRKVPKTRGNIDHIAIAASGVWIIDAKKWDGLVERRDVGGWLKSDLRVYVNGRDRTSLTAGLGWQHDAVRAVLGRADVPISLAACFVAAEWKLFAKPFQHDGVWVTWPKKLVEMMGAPGPLTAEDIADVANRIAVALPPKVPPT